MAKKTRAEKIAAAQRRQASISSQTVSTQTTAQILSNVVPNETEEEKHIRKYFYLDLKKSAWTIAVILVLEFALYYLQLHNQLLFFQ